MSMSMFSKYLVDLDLGLAGGYLAIPYVGLAKQKQVHLLGTSACSRMPLLQRQLADAICSCGRDANKWDLRCTTTACGCGAS